jgi:hypothetical protein
MTHPAVRIDPVWSHADTQARTRFAAKVFTGDIEACWIWTGGIEPDGGYGRWRPPHAAVIAAHRWSYLAHHGPTRWPVIRHHCDIRVCVNPHHLMPGTQAANITDTVQRGGWTTTARTGPGAWPQLAYTLRSAAAAGDRALINQLTARPRQLELLTGF